MMVEQQGNAGPGRFGSSRKKEAAGAARGMLLLMGFECGLLRNTAVEGVFRPAGLG
jgi:hypothetical protein